MHLSWVAKAFHVFKLADASGDTKVPRAYTGPVVVKLRVAGLGWGPPEGDEGQRRGVADVEVAEIFHISLQPRRSSETFKETEALYVDMSV